MIYLALLSFLGGSSASVEDPNTALSGVYSECVLGLDWSCLQKRTLLFVDRLSRAASYPLFPGLLLVRTAPPGDPIEPSALSQLDGEQLGDMVDDAASDFFEEHVLRLQLPNWLKSEGRAMGHVDFFFGDGVEGRKKKKKKKIKKLLKKVLLLAVLLKVGKLLLLIPLGLGLIKIAAIKGLLFGTISLIIMKVMLLKKLMKNKGMMMMGGGGGGGWMDAGGGSSGSGGDSGWPSSGGGGGGGSGGGSGGWDRALAAHQLAYSSYDTKNSPT